MNLGMVVPFFMRTTTDLPTVTAVLFGRGILLMSEVTSSQPLPMFSSQVRK